MKETPLYPLRFAPIYQYRPWGGRRLAELLSAPLPAADLVGEAWLLSDRDDHASLVADGPLTGTTVGELLALFPEQMLGKLSGQFTRFPLLLKFLDVSRTLSVQVHPSDDYPELIPAGDTGKSEAWVVLDTGPEARIYAGLKVGTSVNVLRQAIARGTVADQLASFTPKPGDSLLINAGTVHSLSDVVVFEVQQNSDVTFRLYDWDHLDPRTGRRRPLQVDQAMACIDFAQGAIAAGTPRVQETQPVRRERLIDCDHFRIMRISGRLPFDVGAAQVPRVLVCLAGHGQLEHAGGRYVFGKGDVFLLPSVVGACSCRPQAAVILLEVSLPERFVTS
ncbi:MAG: type I phosphomannose isomerase catalytic subunit [Steroidobacteraceae bacterium]